MGITALSGPSIIYGFTQTSTGRVTEYNEERGPSLSDLGQGILDPRAPYGYYPGAAVGTKVRGFWNNYAAIDQIPTTINTSCIAASQVTTAITNSSFNWPLALVTSTGGPIGAVNLSLPAPEGGTATGLLAIDSTSALPTITFGSGGTIALWDPTKSLSRAVTVTITYLTTTSSFDSGTVYTIAGRDVYGYKMTETITGTTAASSQGKTYTTNKAFKYISGVTVTSCSTQFTGSTGIQVGVADKFGFPMRVDNAAYTTIWWGSSQVFNLITLSSLGHTYASTATATSTTGDVRGTFSSTSASNGTNRLVMFVTPSAQNLPTSSQGSGFTDTSGIFGVTQYSSV